MTKFAAYLFIVLIGANVADYYSSAEQTALAGYVILLGSCYLFVAAGESVWSRLLSIDSVSWVLMFLLPLVLMAISPRSFDRGTWTSQVSCLLVFIAGLLIVQSPNLNRTVGPAALTVVMLGAVLNLYELFVENNVWSTSPGRSAGFYMNPNVSAGVLVGFAGLYFATRLRRLTFSDYSVAGLAFLGIVVTFSRTGVMLTLLVFSFIFWMRSGRVLTLLSVVTALAILAGFFVIYLAPQLELSEGAEQRLFSLMGGTASSDYAAERGPLAAYALDLFYESPVSGVGVRTSLDLPEGPHNMYVGLALDYGVFAVAFYLLLLGRLAWLGFGAMRQGMGNAALILPLTAWLISNGFASHNLLSDPPVLLLLAFIVSASSNVETVSNARYRTVKTNLAY